MGTLHDVLGGVILTFYHHRGWVLFSRHIPGGSFTKYVPAKVLALPPPALFPSGVRSKSNRQQPCILLEVFPYKKPATRRCSQPDPAHLLFGTGSRTTTRRHFTQAPKSPRLILLRRRRNCFGADEPGPSTAEHISGPTRPRPKSCHYVYRGKQRKGYMGKRQRTPTL